MITLSGDIRRANAPPMPPNGGYGGDSGTIDRMYGRGAAEALGRLELQRRIVASHLEMMAAPGPRTAGGPRTHGYNPNEPRDWHGRWTTGGASPDRSVRGLYGGQLYRIQGPGRGIGDNQPPEDDAKTEIPGPDPFPGAPRVPQGWDIPAHVVNGLEYPATRKPVLGDGTPWPIATHDQIQTILAHTRGAIPTMTVYVPQDGIGPMLVGSTATKQFEQPSGYDEVILKGTPQETYWGGVASGHAYDSIDEAIALAWTRQFSKIYFNRSLSTATDRLIEGRIRHDVVAVVGSQSKLPFRFQPYESFSKGQTEPQRQKQMPNDPGLARVYGRRPEQWKKP